MTLASHSKSCNIPDSFSDVLSRKSSLCDEEKAKYAAEAEDAEEFEQEGDSPHGIYITDIPDRKGSSNKPKEVAEVSWRLDVHFIDL